MTEITLPAFLAGDTIDTILARMLGRAPSHLDTAEGSIFWDTQSPVALEVAALQDALREVLRRGFAETTYGAYLDLRCAEHGVTRRAATAAVGTVTCTGLAETAIPAGTQVLVPGSGESSSLAFATDAAATIPAGQTTVAVPVTAVETGAAGNVQAGTIVLLGTGVAGISAVSNAAATTGGSDVESDASLLTRYLLTVRNPSAGGNLADYRRWALEVAGVGDAVVTPIAYGAGTVLVSLIDGEGQPASTSVVDAVLEHIAAPWRYALDPDDLTETTGGGNNYHWWADLEAVLDRPGIYRATVTLHKTGAGTAAPWVTIHAFDPVGGADLHVAPGSSVDAATDLDAGEVSDDAGAPTTITLEFYWPGTGGGDLRIDEAIDAGATLVIDAVSIASLFSQDAGAGMAPVGAAVYVAPAGAVAMTIEADLTLAAGYDPATVQAAVKAALAAYVASLPFGTARTLYYVKVGSAIVDVPGVVTYAGLTVNEDTADIALPASTVATLDPADITLT